MGTSVSNDRSRDVGFLSGEFVAFLAVARRADELRHPHKPGSREFT